MGHASVRKMPQVLSTCTQGRFRRFSRMNGSAMCTLLFVVRLSLGEIRGKNSSTFVCRLLHRVGRCLCARADGTSSAASAASAASRADNGSGAGAGSVCRGGAPVAARAPA